jgi:hypothetical protein
MRSRRTAARGEKKSVVSDLGCRFVIDAIFRARSRRIATRELIHASMRCARVWQTFRSPSRSVRAELVILRESANQSVRNLHGNGRTMMMNERVEIRRGAVQVGVVDEKLVTLHRTLKRIAKARAHLDLQEAEALREAQRVWLWRQFGHASREVSTKRALHDRNFSREQIGDTHVGLNDLSDEQWLAIALRYAVEVLAPRPATTDEQCRLPW